MERPPEASPERNHVIPDGFEPSPGGPKARIEANFAAIKLLRELEDEGRNPTPAEKETLSRYTGWGSFKEAFNKIAYAKYKNDLDNVPHYYANFAERPGEVPYLDKAKRWMDRHGALHERLVSELTPEEFDAASHSITNAHFTSAEVVDAVWEIARKAGYRGGNALEPAGGSGMFLGRTPADLADSTQWEAVELDEVTARLLSKLYPEARVNSVRPDPGRTVAGQGFQAARIPNNSQDLVISNVPFAKVGPGTSKAEFGIAFNLHNYFFAKALTKAKPGGLVVFITTHNTMDASSAQREWLANHGELVHAVRLPDSAFKENAGTEVVTDIVVMRKPDGRPAPVRHSWQSVVEVGSDVVEKTLWRAEQAWDTKMSNKAVMEGLQSVPRGWRPEDPAVAAAWDEWDHKRPEGGIKAKALIEAVLKHGIRERDRNKRTVLRMNFRAPVEANEFFRANPHLVVGRHSMTGSMYREAEYNVSPPPGGRAGFLDALRTAVESAPDVGRASQSAAAETRTAAADMGDRVGSFVSRDGKVYQVLGNARTGESTTLEEVKWTPTQHAIFRSWDRLRAATEELLALETAMDSTDAEIEAKRAEVNRLYDRHVGAHGHPANPSRQTNHKLGKEKNKHTFLEGDARGYPLVQSLEIAKKDTDPATGRQRMVYRKAPILLQRVLQPVEAPQRTESVEDALTASMGWLGRVDLDYMAETRGQTAEQVRAELIERRYAFEDPLTGLLVLADEYLSGPVVEKLRAARAAAETDSRLIARKFLSHPLGSLPAEGPGSEGVRSAAQKGQQQQFKVRFARN